MPAAVGAAADRLALARPGRARLVVLHLRAAAGGRRGPRDPAGHRVPPDAGRAAGRRQPGRARKSRCRPFDPSALDDRSTVAQLAGWLVAEYQERGGDELRKVVADWCGTEHSLLPRVQKVHKELHARHSPIAISGPPSPFVPVSTVQAPEHEPDRPLVPAESRGSAPSAADEPVLAGPEQAGPQRAGPTEGLPLEAEAAVSPPAPSPARDQDGPVSGASTPAEDREIPGQQTEASPAGADEVPGGDLDRAWPGQPDRLPRQDQLQRKSRDGSQARISGRPVTPRGPLTAGSATPRITRATLGALSPRNILLGRKTPPTRAILPVRGTAAICRTRMRRHGHSSRTSRPGQPRRTGRTLRIQNAPGSPRGIMLLVKSKGKGSLLS